jgi:hypothetical protein
LTIHLVSTQIDTIAIVVTETRPARGLDRLGFHVVDVPDPGPLTYVGVKIS